ncbi:MAG: ABC transporter ATP-binding protein/permease [Alphaproteobacteria bacterium]
MTPPPPKSGAKKEKGPEPGYGRRALATLLPYLWPKAPAEDWLELRFRVVAAMACLVLAKVTVVYVPILFKEAVDALTPTGGAAVAAVPVAVLLAYGAARVFGVAFAELRDAIFAKVAHRSMRQLALRTFRHLHALSLRYHLERQTGGLSRAIERGTKGIENLLSWTLFTIFPTIVEILLVTVVLWAMLDAWFALIVLVTVAVYAAYTVAVTEWRIKYRRQLNESDSDASTKAIDSLLNYETVKYFGNEEHEANRFDKAMRRYERAAVLSDQSLSLLNVGQGFIIAVGLTLVMYRAGAGVVAGTMTVGEFVLVNAYLLQLYQPLNMLGFMYREVKQALVDMESMFSLLRVHREIQDKPGAPPLAVAGGEVAFDRVKFRYEERRSILHEVSFRVPAGKTVAIVGPSGAGKSTISRILFRFYDVEGGSVRIDGQDIRDVTQASLRNAIGIVPQDTVLFNDTLYYNIAYGRPGATREEVEEAARLAHLHHFIANLPDGYEAMVGERGLKLSGGEKQRVAIARTILKRPRILIFDEATSALDTHTEKEIQSNLREVSADRTTLVIAHRLSTIIDADEIIVLDKGRIVERGRHGELLASEGVYAALWRRQQEAAGGEAAKEAPELPAPGPEPAADERLVAAAAR